MKNIVVTLLVMAVMVFAMVGGAGAYSQSANNLGHGYYINGGAPAYLYAFDTPTDFTVPSDTVNLANLVLTGDPDWLVGRSDITVAGEDFGSLDNYFVATHSGVNTYQIDLASLFANHWAGGNDNMPLTLKISQNGFGWLDGFTLLSATFNLDYTNKTDSPQPPDNTPNPEPCTLLLLGSGLAGLAFKKRNRQA